VAKGKKKKRASYSPPPPLAKRPRWIGPPTLQGRHISWRFGHADNGGRWAWSKASGASLERIMKRLATFEAVDYGHGIKDVLSRVFTNKLAPSARQRLSELQRDDVEILYGWHITGKERLWCAEYDGMMCVLWWDAKHEVYPVEKKHT
jgi:hypothetical protein